MDHLYIQYMRVRYHMCACAHKGVHAEAVGGGREPTANNKPRPQP